MLGELCHSVSDKKTPLKINRENLFKLRISLTEHQLHQENNNWSTANYIQGKNIGECQTNSLLTKNFITFQKAKKNLYDSFKKQ